MPSKLRGADPMHIDKTLTCVLRLNYVEQNNKYFKLYMLVSA